MSRRTICPSCRKAFIIPEGYLDSYRNRWFCSEECSVQELLGYPKDRVSDNPPRRVICEEIEELTAQRDQLAQQIDILQTQMENIESRIYNLTPPKPQTPGQKASNDYLKRKIMEIRTT